jgi:hypothetical protein
MLQIIQSVTWSIDVEFPSPFSGMMSAFSVFSFDFLSLECLFNQSNHFVSVYLWSVTPIAVAVGLVATYALRFKRTNAQRAALTNRVLLLGFLALPPVSLKLLQALDCVTVAGKSYLRVDTSIDCDSAQFKQFAVVDGLLIVAYLSIPLVWYALLSSKREALCPASAVAGDNKHALFMRNNDLRLAPLQFLFASYKPTHFFVECIEM